jgi:hypothetical protein
MEKDAQRYRRQQVAEIDASIMSIPARTGYCPKRWSQAVDVMIPKKVASKNVKKLRIIVLFHALFNMMNKRVAQKATRQAMATKVIPSEIYAKPGHRAMGYGLKKVLTTDIS